MVDCVAELSIEVIGRPLRTPREDLLRAVDPEHFVNIRAIPGGPRRRLHWQRSSTRKPKPPKINAGYVRNPAGSRSILRAFGTSATPSSTVQRRRNRFSIDEQATKKPGGR